MDPGDNREDGKSSVVREHTAGPPIPWDKPNGCCSHCGAPLNEHLIGGYKLHDGTFSVAAKQN